MKRQRGRGRKPGGGGGGGGGHGNRPFESSGPEVKIRGTAAQIYDKYMQYARDAHSAGDRVRYENFLQHAEHYYRIMAATMPRDRVQAATDGSNHGGGPEDRDHEDSPGALKGADDIAEDDGPEVAEAATTGADRDDDEDEADAAGEDRSADEARGRRRRGRRRRPEGAPSTERGGDTEARSALDALAQRQAAVAGG